MTEIAALGLKVEGVEGIDRAAASIDKLTTAADKAETAGDGLSSAFKAFTANQERMISSLSSVEGHLSEISKGMSKVGSSAKDVAPASKAIQGLDDGVLEVVKSLSALGAASKDSGAAAAASFAAFAAQQQKTTASVDGLSTSFKELFTEQQKNASAFAAMNANLAKISQSLSQSGDAARKSSDEVKGLRASYESLRAGYDPAYAASQKYKGATDTLNTALSKGAITSKEHSEATAMAKKEYDSASTSASGLKGSLTTLSASLAAVGVGFSIGAVKSFAQAVFEASASAERLKISLDFSSALGSGAEIEYLRKTTQALGLEFSTTAKAYQSFSAATRGTALEGAKTREVFESIAKASAVMGLSAENTSGVLLALQQMVSKGTVASEELRGQLGERLPGAFATAARAMGVTTAELGKMLEQGLVVADDFLPKFARELNKSMGDAAEKAADRLDAAVNKANNAWDRFKQNVGDAGVSAAMAETSNRWAGSLDAISLAMEQARAQGSGFWGQVAAAAGTFQTMTTLTGAATVNMYANAKATAEAEKELARLQKIADTQGTSAWLLKEMGNVRRYIGELQQARREKEGLTGAGSTPAYVEGMGNSKTIEKQRADYEAASKAYLDLTAKRDGVTKDFVEKLATLEKALEKGIITEKQYVKEVTEANVTRYKSTDAAKEAEKASKSGASATKAEQTSFQNLIATIKEKIKINDAELFNAGALTESQKLRIQLEAKLEAGSKKMSDAHQTEVKGLIAKLKAQEDFDKAAKRAITLNDARIASEEEMNKAMADMDRQVTQVKLATFEYSQSIADQIEMTEMETKTIGMNSQARQVLIEQLRIEQDLRKRRDAINAAPFASDEARNAALSALDAEGAKAMALAQRKAYVSEWEKTSQMIGDTLSDYIMGGGKDAATYLKRLFSTLVLQPVVQAAVGGLLGSAGGGSSGGPGQSLQSAWSNFSGGLSGSLGSSIATIGTQIGSTAATAFGSGIAAGGQLGLFGSLSQGSALIGSGVAGSTASGLGTMIGGAGPWIAGAAALLSVLKGFDDSGTPHSGAGAVYSKAMGLQTGAGIYNQGTFGLGTPEEYSEAMQDGISGIAKGLGQTLDAFSVAFGKTAGYSIATAFADDSSKDGAWGSLKIADEVGKVLVNWEDTRSSKWAPREFANGEEGYKQYLNAVAMDVKKAFVAMDLPGWADSILDTAKDVDTLNAALQQIAAVKTVFDSLGKTMTIFSGISDDVQGRLLKASDGVEALASNAEAFYEGFYTEGERAIKQRELQISELGRIGLYIDPAEGDLAKAAFKKSVQDAMESGRVELVAQLLAMSGAFAQTADYAQQLADDAEDAAKSLRDSLGSLEVRFTGGGFSRQYQADDAAAQLQKLLSGAGIQKDAGALTNALLSATTVDVEEYFREIWNVLDTEEARQKLVSVTGAMVELATAAESAKKALRDSLIGLEGRFSGGGFSRQYRAEDAAAQLQKLLSGVGIEKDAAGLASTLMSATASEVESYFREIWNVLPTDAAKLELTGLANTMLDLAAATDSARESAAKAAAQAVSGAWANLGTASGWAAQYLGDSSGLQAQMGMVQASYQGATTVEGREAALGQIIALEQSIWQVEEQNRQAAAQAAQKQAQALQGQLSAVNAILGATQRLREYAEGLFAGAASGLSDAERLDVLAAQYSAQLTLAKGGDVEAMSKLQGVTSDYLALAEQMSGSQSEYSALSSKIASELAATAFIQEVSAKTQAGSLQAQINAASAAAQYASQQFEVSESTKVLIAKQLSDSAKQFENEMLAMQEQLRVGMDANLLLQGLPSALTGVLNKTLVPVIGTIANAAMYAASMAASSAESARMAAAAAAASAAATADAALAGMAFDGSHAGGLSNVPFNGYRAILHKDEAVLTAEENRAYMSSGSSSGSVRTNEIVSAIISMKNDSRLTYVELLSRVGQIARVLNSWDGNGLPDKREETA